MERAKEPVQDVLQAVDDIPVHIGAVELKSILFERLLPAWKIYTRGYPLEIDDIIMRTKDWVEIQPLNPDRSVISRPFFKHGKNGATTFKPGRCLINFHVPNRVYDDYLNYLERLGDNDHSTDRVRVSAFDVYQVFNPPLIFQNRQGNISNDIRSTPRGQKRLRSLSPEQSHTSTHLAGIFSDTVNTTTTTSAQVNLMPSPKRTKICHEVSPTTRRLGNALRLQKPPTAQEVQSLCKFFLI